MKSEIIYFKTIGDHRGGLIALENHHNIPFDIKRAYYIFDTKIDVRRGYHAHKNLKQLAICVSGSCKFLLNDGSEEHVFELDSPNYGLYIDGLVWREMFDFSVNCVLLVLADNYYDESDYIRDFNCFLKLVDKESQ